MNHYRREISEGTKYFIAINCGGTPIKISGPVVVDMKAGSSNSTEAYYTIE